MQTARQEAALYCLAVEWPQTIDRGQYEFRCSAKKSPVRK
jgi:hypothetical protein